MAKICISSTRFYDHEIGGLSSILLEDMELYNKMVRYSYKVLYDNRRYHNFDEKKLHKHLKEKFGTNDYFPLSAVLEARRMLNLQIANDRTYRNKINKRLKNINTKIKKEKAKLKRDQNLLKKIISYTKGKSSNIKCFDFLLADGDMCILNNGETMSLYLYEVTVLKPRIKATKNKLSKLHFSHNRFMFKKNGNKMSGVCFGGKKLMKSRNTVYKDNHDEWLKQYRNRRNCQMTITGRSQGKWCNNLFKYDGNDNMTYNAVSKDKYNIKLDFPYCKDELLRVLNMKHSTPGKAVCYTLVRKNGYFIIRAIIELAKRTLMYNGYNGVIGVDINSNHLALVETDRYGNIVNTWSINLDLKGKTSGQRKHIIREAALETVDKCDRSYKPMVLEQLDFDHYFDRYNLSNRALHKVLSEYAYSMILEALNSRAYKKGIGVIEVNPAYTSIIGKHKYSSSKGLSVHHAAAYCIARRGQGYKERIPKKYQKLITDKRKPLKNQWQELNKLLA